MDIDRRAKSEQELRSDRGFTLVQVLITVCLIAIVSTFGIMGIASARASLRLSSSTRELAGYLEKARSNAIRRNATATVNIVNANTYTVTMDSDGDGTVEIRTITLQNGVTFDNGAIGVSAVFDWRGRIPNQLGIVLNNDRGRSSSINVSGSGDVTLDSEIFQDSAIGDVTLNSDVPAGVASPSPGSYPSPTPSPGTSPTPTPEPTATPTPTPTPSGTDPTPTPTPTPSGTDPTPTPTATPTPVPTATPSPSPSPTPVPCSISAPSSLTFPKNGSPKTFTISVSNGNSSLITASYSGDINSVTPVSTTVTGSGSILYTVNYANGDNKSGTITLTSTCGNKSIPVAIN